MQSDGTVLGLGKETCLDIQILSKPGGNLLLNVAYSWSSRLFPAGIEGKRRTSKPGKLVDAASVSDMASAGWESPGVLLSLCFFSKFRVYL